MKKKKRKSKKAKAKGSPQPLVTGRTPQAAPSPNFWSVTVKGGSAALLALSIVGGFQTIFSMSAWATWFLQSWHSLCLAFWNTLWRPFGFEVTSDLAIVMTFVFGLLGVAFSAAALEFRDARYKPPSYVGKGFAQALFDDELNLRRAEGIAVGVLLCIYLATIGQPLIFDMPMPFREFSHPWLAALMLGTGLLAVPTIFLSRSWSDLGHVCLLLLSFVALYSLMLLPAVEAATIKGTGELPRFNYMIVNMALFIVPAKLMSFLGLARPRYWNYRFVTIWLTVVTLFVLDTIPRVIAMAVAFF